ncbi:MAG: tetratricopeptide repeat protein [Capnocytophaga sp.]|nr:tetratricopeptide repeat protein [Capnocytophaga sp.]
MKRILYISAFFSVTLLMAQDKEALQKSLDLSDKYTFRANEALSDKKPVQAEMAYRKAISENKNNNTAQYNLGNTHYQQQSYGEALLRYKNAAITENATSAEKHKAMHNLGNVMMQVKAYDKAVEAYKEALRNDPTDEETRYNLAVAQDMLKKNPPQNQDNQDQNQDNQDNQNQDNQDQNQNQDNQDKGDNKDNQDKGDNDQKEQGDNKENQDTEQGNDQKEPNENSNDQKQNDDGQGEKRPSGLSPKQIERILEAMNNEERKVQEKINAQKIPGKPVRSEKDW